MKRTMLYQVDKDGHVTPIFATSEAPKPTRRVLREWVNIAIMLFIFLALMAAPAGLYDLAVWIFGGSQ